MGRGASVALSFALAFVSSHGLAAETEPAFAPPNVLLDNLLKPVEPIVTDVAVHVGNNASPASPARVSESKVAEQLSVLSTWSFYDAYKAFLMEIPGPLTVRSKAAAPGLFDPSKTNSVADPQIRQVRMFEVRSNGSVAPEKGSILVHWENNLTTGAMQNGSDSDQFNAGFRYFVRLPCIGIDVPDQVFHATANSFISGFVTRLVLEEFQKVLPSSTLPNLPEPTSRQSLTPPTAFENPSAWPDNKKFDDAAAAIYKENPLNGDAMMCGWYAGQELVASGESRYTDAAHKLIKMRFESQKIGQMVGYTLSYLSGYAASARVGAAAQKDEADLSLELAKVNASSAVDKKYFENSYSPVSQALFSALASSLGDGNTASDANFPRGDLAKFLIGFNAGGINAADVVYAQTFFLAYGIGHRDGFREGYSAGYADGRRKGFEEGRASVTFSFFDGVWNFIQGVADNAGPIGTVISAIASIW